MYVCLYHHLHIFIIIIKTSIQQQQYLNIMLKHLIVFFSILIPILNTKQYRNGQPIVVQVQELDSRSTHLHFDYSYLQLCPLKQQQIFAKKLGFEINMLSNKLCSVLCEIQLTQQNIKKFEWMIDHNYEIFYNIDQIPALYRESIKSKEDKQNKDFTKYKNYQYDLGFPIGKYENNSYYINNNINIIIRYKKINDDAFRILNFIIQETDQSLRTNDKCQFSSPTLISLNQTTSQKIKFQYIVFFQESQQEILLQPDISSNQRITWIAFSLSINLIYCISIASIIYKNLLDDLKNCTKNIFGTTVHEFVQMSQQRDSGWKQHRRQVFRAPQHKTILASLTGAGVQVIIIVFTILILMYWEELHYFEFQSTKIKFEIQCVVLFSSFLSGFISAKIYKMWGGQNWLGCSLLSSIILPISLIIGFSIDNTMRMIDNAISNSFFEMIFFPLLWLLFSIPLTVIGSIVGYKRKTIKHPFSVNAVPEKRLYDFNLRKQIIFGFFASLVPYISFAVEYRVLLDSFWQKGKYDYYIFSFTSLIILVISSGLASIITTYKSLNKGNPRWWGIPFIISGGIALMFMIVETIYLIIEMQITRVTSIVIYFAWSSMSVIIIFLFCGAAGFIINTIFVRQIFRLIKID